MLSMIYYVAQLSDIRLFLYALSLLFTYYLCFFYLYTMVSIQSNALVFKVYIIWKHAEIRWLVNNHFEVCHHVNLLIVQTNTVKCTVYTDKIHVCGCSYANLHIGVDVCYEVWLPVWPKHISCCPGPFVVAILSITTISF